MNIKWIKKEREPPYQLLHFSIRGCSGAFCPKNETTKEASRIYAYTISRIVVRNERTTYSDRYVSTYQWKASLLLTLFKDKLRKSLHFGMSTKFQIYAV